MLGLEVLELFSGCAFLMSVFRVFVRKKLRVNVPVAIFFSVTVDCLCRKELF